MENEGDDCCPDATMACAVGLADERVRTRGLPAGLLAATALQCACIVEILH